MFHIPRRGNDGSSLTLPGCPIEKHVGDVPFAIIPTGTAWKCCHTGWNCYRCLYHDPSAARINVCVTLRPPCCFLATGQAVIVSAFR